MDYLGLFEPPSRGRARLGGSQAASWCPAHWPAHLPVNCRSATPAVTVRVRPCVLQGSPGHTRASLTVFLWLKGLSIRKREQSAAASDGPGLRSLSSWPRDQHEESVQCYSAFLLPGRPMLDTGACNPCRRPLTGTDGIQQGRKWLRYNII